MKAMLFAAGLGTRLKPFTDTHPKALLQINGKSLLQRNIEYLQESGIKDVIINIHHFAEQVEDLLKKHEGFGSSITISDERNQILETGGGLKKAGSFLEDSDPFIVMNADVLTDMNIREMIDHHVKNKPLATLAVTNRISSRYFLFDEKDDLCGWKNEKTNEQILSREVQEYHKKAFSGIHIISPKIFELMAAYEKDEKFSLVQLYLEISKTNKLSAFDHSETRFIDVGKPESVQVAEQMFR